MPAVNREDLKQAITVAFEELGWSAALVSTARPPNPRKLHVWREDGERLSVWMYVWTLTPGGRKSLPHEYRIQKTGVVSPLPLNGDGVTVIMGYQPDLKMFAGFDLARHHQFTEGSPSAQIDIRVVRRAISTGLAFDKKSNDEIAIGIRPDQLLNYIKNAQEIHRWASSSAMYESVESVNSRELDEASLPQMESSERQRIVSTVRRLVRTGNFRRAVLGAYDKRCAVTGLQLRVVQAAHILPVSAPDSTDVVQNGIALSPTYHIAYDNGLIFLDDQFKMQLNKTRVKELRDNNLNGGLDMFAEPLGEIIFPASREQWPDPRFIRKANNYRGIHS